MDTAYSSFVLGYHGCDRSIAERVLVGGERLKPSINDYDWLGSGIYFWEHNAQRAMEFAREMASRPHPSGQKIEHPAVVGAIIDLGHCLNLLDSRSIEMVRDAYQNMVESLATTQMAIPKNRGCPDLVDRKLDCAVIQSLHEQRQESGGAPFDSVRAAFVEGPPIYEGAGFSTRTHIQVCVRNPVKIIGHFWPLDDAGDPLRFD